MGMKREAVQRGRVPTISSNNSQINSALFRQPNNNVSRNVYQSHINKTMKNNSFNKLNKSNYFMNKINQNFKDYVSNDSFELNNGLNGCKYEQPNNNLITLANAVSNYQNHYNCLNRQEAAELQTSCEQNKPGF